jgi:mono/diheme cytochrome c family protein
MRIAGLFILLLGSLPLRAQDSAPKIKRVGAKPTSAVSGKEMFHAYCASCHGMDGNGNGPAAPALKKPPTDLTLLAKQNNGKFPAMQAMSSIKDGTEAGHGSKDMPIWGPILSSVSNSQGVVDQRVGNLVGYIESLQKK